MSRLKISELSFCEIATEKDVQIKAGWGFEQSLIDNSFYSLLFGYTREQVYFNQDYVVDKLKTTNTSKSGYIVSSKDSKSKAGVVVNQTTNRTVRVAFASSFT
ncbi:hypothetical protein [Halotia branconii]|uniref:Uncharacterized protein n=1 Tax=Halotia branconii CENA392 TaxID=1539056 RepID=A0AAJ6NT52_9CYAN|nr:hypothetical protein [Halotia branconii]WGV26004.1 hypothetical protein QI031_00315 [Halotia branconii CENA392]